MRHEYQGRLDPETGLFQGQGTLSFPAPASTSRGAGRGRGRAGGGAELCILDPAPALQSIAGRFQQGLPSGSVDIKLSNLGQMKVGQVRARDKELYCTVRI